MSKTDGGPAFPSHGTMGEVCHEGMTLRDYFAGQALAGLNANAFASQQKSRTKAAWAYQDADAMLEQRLGKSEQVPRERDR